MLPKENQNLSFFNKVLFCNVQKQSPRGVLKKRCLKIGSKFAGDHPCLSEISIKLQIFS